MPETSDPPTAHLRRTPQQSRGLQRIQKIVEVAEGLFATHSYDAVTTNAIAEQAGISIGSLYHFFPNKEAILQEVISRYQQMINQAFAPFATEPGKPALPAQEISDQFVDLILEIGTRNPAFALLVLQAAPDSPVWEAAQRLHGDIIRNIEILLTLQAPQLTAEQRKVHALTSNVAVSALLARICHEIQNGNHALAKELMIQAKQMQRAYLDSAV